MAIMRPPPGRCPHMGCRPCRLLHRSNGGGNGREMDHLPGNGRDPDLGMLRGSGKAMGRYPGNGKSQDRGKPRGSGREMDLLPGNGRGPDLGMHRGSGKAMGRRPGNGKAQDPGMPKGGSGRVLARVAKHIMVQATASGRDKGKEIAPRQRQHNTGRCRRL